MYAPRLHATAHCTTIWPSIRIVLAAGRCHVMMSRETRGQPGLFRYILVLLATGPPHIVMETIKLNKHKQVFHTVI